MNLPMFEVSQSLVLMLFCAAFLAGFVDAIAGGGGIITLPALLLAGASPLEALATNKLQGSFGAGTAMIGYARAGQIRIKDQLGSAAISAAAGAGGALAAHLVPTDALRVIMPLALVGVAGFFAFKPGLTDTGRQQRLSPALFAFAVVPLIAAYDGFFGPGTGSFFMLGFVLLAGFGMLKAVAHTKMLNFASNLGALAVFIFAGAPWWGIGAGMAVAQVGGAALGARLAVRLGAGLIRPLLVTTSLLMAGKLAWSVI